MGIPTARVCPLLAYDGFRTVNDQTYSNEIVALRLGPLPASHCERQRSNPWLGIARSKMDCFAPLAMTIKFTTQDHRHTFAISPQVREFCQSSFAI
jgi:hypothetical protein